MKKPEMPPFSSIISSFRNRMIRPVDQGRPDTLLYWQQTIFVALMLTLLTLGLIASVTGAFMFYREGNIPMTAANILYYVIVFGIAFMKEIRFSLRRMFLGWGIYAIGIILLISTGPYGAGLLYLCTAYVFLALNSTGSGALIHISVNALVFGILSILFMTGRLNRFPVSDYREIWWIIVINVIAVSVFIILMVNLIIRGLNRRYRKELEINRILRQTREENLKQIRLLSALRQSGNCVTDTRIPLPERLKTVQEILRKELPVRESTLALTGRDSDYSFYTSSVPPELTGLPFHRPDIDGPYLLLHKLAEDNRTITTALMRRLLPGESYFGSPFYTPRKHGFLELILSRDPDEAELNFLQMNLFQLGGALTNDQLFQDVKTSRDRLEASYDEILQAWASILELRDIETKGHSHRVAGISLKLAALSGLSAEEQIHLKRGAFLHDIGKLGIPDRILKKEGSLTEEEWQLMRQHPEIGRNSVCRIPFLQPAVPVIYHHHERWDGTGYPAGLSGSGIPQSARIFIIADVYDALASDRPYRKAMKQEEILAYMSSQREKLFDPELIGTFLDNVEQITGVPAAEEPV